MIGVVNRRCRAAAAAGDADHQWCCRTCHDTAGRAYRRCYECGHPYRTKWHLLAAYRAARPAVRPPEIGWWRALLGGHWRPARIGFCQCCIHDF